MSSKIYFSFEGKSTKKSLSEELAAKQLIDFYKSCLHLEDNNNLLINNNNYINQPLNKQVCVSFILFLFKKFFFRRFTNLCVNLNLISLTWEYFRITYPDYFLLFGNTRGFCHDLI